MKLPVYLDNHSTTPVDKRVVEAMLPYFTEHFGNAASRHHSFGWQAEVAVEHARKVLARSVNAEPKEIIFTSGATEANNLALKGIAESLRGKGRHIITSKTEHRSVLDVCGVLEKSGYRVTVVDVDRYGIVHPETIREAMTDETILVSVMMANNEIGTLAPISEIGRLCLERGVLLHTDATQSLGKIPIDVQALNIHLMSMSAHKIYGPKGVGALYVRAQNPRVQLTQQMDGGGHERGMRSGTMNVPAIVGFGVAVEIACEEMTKESVRVGGLRDRLEKMLLSVDSASRNGHPSNRLYNNLNVTFPYVRADGLMAKLKKDAAFSSGSACSSADLEAGHASHVLTAIGVDEDAARNTIRIGLGRFTTQEEIDFAGAKIVEAVNNIRSQSPQYAIENKEKNHGAVVS
ncbi:MAG TPA: aminotransferase class V-fold PLP-dependent enzyme [Bacteroidota bacterium]|nr:aminotransferase class V-fold PLP-dependent enzyme [Bacteroidota bacterium]